LRNGFDKEDLLAVLMGMPRFVLDTNSLSTLRDASIPANRTKAFILGHTVAEEVENCEALLFGRNVENANNNIFNFGFMGEDRSPVLGPCVVINRLDPHYRVVFDGRALREESRERAKRTDAEFLKREKAVKTIDTND